MVGDGILMLVGTGNDGAVMVQFVVDCGCWGKDVGEVVVWHWFVPSNERVLILLECF